MAHLPAVVAHHAGDVEPWPQLVHVGLGLAQRPVEDGQVAQLVALEVVLAHRQLDGLVDDLHRELRRHRDLVLGVGGDHHVQIVSVGSRVVGLAVLDQALASDGQLGPQLLLELAQSVASGA